MERDPDSQTTYQSSGRASIGKRCISGEHLLCLMSCESSTFILINPNVLLRISQPGYWGHGLSNFAAFALYDAPHPRKIMNCAAILVTCRAHLQNLFALVKIHVPAKAIHRAGAVSSSPDNFTNIVQPIQTERSERWPAPRIGRPRQVGVSRYHVGE